MTRHEPYKIKAIRNLNFFSYPERLQFLREARFNVGNLPSSIVTFDMVTQGSSAMSQEQVGAQHRGDEAYAGARNFYHLIDTISDVFGLKHVCPIHNLHGGIKLLSAVYISKGNVVAGNTPSLMDVVGYYGGSYRGLPKDQSGNIDINLANQLFEKEQGNLPFVFIDLNETGNVPISLEMLAQLKKSANQYDSRLVLNISHIAGYSLYLKKNFPSCGGKKIADIFKDVILCADTVVFDAGQDGMSNVGGFLATNNEEENERYQNEVVVYEGLHTYGGMAGRTMEVVSLGLKEMAIDLNAEWIDFQVSRLADSLEEGGVSFSRGYNGVYLNLDKVLGDSQTKLQTVAAALYLTAGIRIHLEGKFGFLSDLPVLIPRRVLLNTQIEQIAQAIVAVFKQIDKISPVVLQNQPVYHFESEFEWIVPNLDEYIFTSEPYVIHSIEHVGMTGKEHRQKAIDEAGYNTFLLKSEDITIDFLTDSGTSAMSVEQWAAYETAQETPAMSDAYLDILETSQEIYGYDYVILTHQGRAAEHIMSQMFIKPGDYVPGNMYFTTTKLHQEFAGGIFADVIVDEAHDTQSEYPWKGNIDLKKLSALYDKAVSENKKISYVSFEFNVNMAGGQPVSMDNIKEVYQFCSTRDIPVFFDATRCAENACFIQKRDPNYRDVPIRNILLEMFSYGNGATISCKKDMLSNLSGSLLFRDNEEWYRKGLHMLQLFEGPYSSGGTSAGDMAAHAQGLREMVDDDYINSRVDQTAFLGKLLSDAGVPIVKPSGGHAIFLDARAFLDHIDQEQYPAQRLAAQIFVETGLRSMERGNVSKGRDPHTGKNYQPALELVRLTIPRRVYSRDHLRVAAEGIIRLYKKRGEIRGLEFTYEPEKLRFFQGRFKKISS